MAADRGRWHLSPRWHAHDLMDGPAGHSGLTSNVDDIAGLEASTKVVHEIDREVANGTPSTSIVLGGFSRTVMRSWQVTPIPNPAGIVGFSGWAARKGEWARSWLKAPTPKPRPSSRTANTTTSIR